MAGHNVNKFMLFSASILALATAICPLTGNDRGTFTATSGNFLVVWWRPTTSTVSFNVSVTTPSSTWGAIGFSNDRLMVISCTSLFISCIISSLILMLLLLAIMVLEACL